ncbi:cell wall metabolism sensor histidine kinase WalK [Phormidium yuhuli AB48]|uniref:histidine kinase n=2 Tax=Phormidium TaxID=1198 RepID=A0ABY5ALM9_9CYAN|nr:ATP-binding protein [Phormidium yuhuli]USR90119.1 cell wall metabolism sensor histidine kinase WalK [Phormidium yuhuli AB48]
MAAATLVVSLIVSGLTFWATNTIQQDARLNDTRFGRDLGLLLAANVTQLIAEDNKTELARFSSQFYSRTSSVRYILYADEEGRIFFGIPYSESTVQNSLQIQRRIQLPEEMGRSQQPFVRQHNTPNGQVTDVFVPLVQGDRHLGVMAIGINPNPTVVTSSGLTRDVTIAVFVSIWVMVILGAVFNALTITRPIKELLVGVKNIASGNFRQRVDLPFGGELGELIESFNEMAERLERYEEQNIEELTAEKAKLETLVSTIADGAVLLDNEMNVVLVNPTARRIFGWDDHTLIGTNVLHAFPAAIQVELTRPLYQMAKGERDSGEFRISISEPTPRMIRILVTTVLDRERENVKGIAITVQDITREVELNEAKSQFISNISHELRTPLFNIKSFIETLHEYGDDLSDRERREFLETANHETDRLTRLVNDVLDLSRLESCRIYRLEPLDILQPIEQTLRTYQLNAKDKEIELKQEVEEGLPSVLGHYDLLLQVFANLVGNALKFTEAGGKVIVRAYLLSSMTPEDSHTMEGATRYVRVEIADTGIGIGEEDREAIFDRFFRVENRVHTLEGTGLGLSIVRNIIDKHHTNVNLVSEVGVGTTFWFDLAVAEASSKPGSIPMDATPKLTVEG